MNNFAQLITPERAKYLGDSRPLSEIRALTLTPDFLCCNCRKENAWRYADRGLCFTCATGQIDASGNFELIFDIDALLGNLLARADAPKGSDPWMHDKGFTWDTFDTDFPRWRHVKTGISIRRRPEWSNREWTERKIDIAERAQTQGHGPYRPPRRRRHGYARPTHAPWNATAC
jgi:hypothetical protein